MPDHRQHAHASVGDHDRALVPHPAEEVHAPLTAPSVSLPPEPTCLVSIYPLARCCCAPYGVFTSLLMSTGLTLGTISSLYGLSAGIIDETQFSLLIAVAVLSAIVPTVIAQRFLQPDAGLELAHGGAEAESEAR